SGIGIEQCVPQGRIGGVTRTDERGHDAVEIWFDQPSSGEDRHERRTNIRVRKMICTGQHEPFSLVSERCPPAGSANLSEGPADAGARFSAGEALRSSSVGDQGTGAKSASSAGKSRKCSAPHLGQTVWTGLLTFQ